MNPVSVLDGDISNGYNSDLTNRFGEKILFYNVAGLNNKKDFPGFWKLIDSAIIFCLVETWHLHSPVYSLISSRFKIIESMAVKYPGVGRPSGGLVVGMDVNYVSKMSLLYDSRFLLVIQLDVLSLKDILLMVGYVPPDKKYDSYFVESLGIMEKFFCENKKVLIGIDFNARMGHPDLLTFFVDEEEDSRLITRNSRDNVYNDRGKKLYFWCVNNNLLCLNGLLPGDFKGDYTFHSSAGSSVIDYFLTSQDIYKYLITDIMILPEIYSDHFPIICFLYSLSNLVLTQEKCSRWIPSRGSLYNQQVDYILSSEFDYVLDHSNLIYVLSKAAINCGLLIDRRSTSVSNRYTYIWFDEECYCLRK